MQHALISDCCTAYRYPSYTLTLHVQGHIGQQPLDAVPSFGGSTTAGTESSYRLWDPSKVPSPRKIVAALDKFVVGQEGSKKVHRQCAVQECSARHA